MITTNRDAGRRQGVLNDANEQRMADDRLTRAARKGIRFSSQGFVLPPDKLTVEEQEEQEFIKQVIEMRDKNRLRKGTKKSKPKITVL